MKLNNIGIFNVGIINISRISLATNWIKVGLRLIIRNYNGILFDFQ